MAISYNKLWNLVRQNKMKKGDLARAANISDYTMGKLNKDLPVQMVYCVLSWPQNLQVSALACTLIVACTEPYPGTA